MKYVYTAIYSIKGIALSPESGDVEVIKDPTRNLRAFITSQVNSHCFEGDRALAVAGLMLRALFQAEPSSREFKERVSDAVESVRASRQKEFGNGPFLAVVTEGEVAAFNPSDERDAGDFIVCFEACPKDSIREQFQDAITAMVSSLAATIDKVIAVRKVTDPVVFVREDGKPVYSYTPSVGPVNAYISSPLTAEQVSVTANLYRLLSVERELQRVTSLLRSSMGAEDTLRSFLSAWTALEILVNKLFKTYEQLFFNSLMDKRHPDARERYLSRIREVMKDKYRLTDKFAAIVFQLAPETADADLESFRRTQKTRDSLLHGEAVEETSLPVGAARDLAWKYLRLHLEEVERQRVAGPNPGRTPLECDSSDPQQLAD